MGWSSGSELMDAIIVSTKKNVKDENVRRRLYEDFIAAFEYADCDTLYECEGADPAFDKAIGDYEDRP